MVHQVSEESDGDRVILTDDEIVTRYVRSHYIQRFSRWGYALDHPQRVADVVRKTGEPILLKWSHFPARVRGVMILESEYRRIMEEIGHA